MVALAGCTASGGEGKIDPDDYTVRGVENSEVYHDGRVQEPNTISIERLLRSGKPEIALEFDPEAEYDPTDYDVYLMDGDTVVADGYVGGALGLGADQIEFEIDTSILERRPTYRVVSMQVTQPTDEFELEIVRTGSGSE
ncbi:hypothetical protein HYG81_19500 (plasmid) [Natrinema zhouii]|uniref:hypothetical protein n=1 Tax=Natrinema zhouii TaxID=1710539 RepID=UPI001CFFEE66|nr:hypothetical protein [Natrinema zhouii]UHQ98264.1 hypothetical protein HYG81_19500 [Natrinema zhouii]